MKTPQFLSRLRQRDRAELFAAACVGVCIFFLLLLSFAVILLVDHSTSGGASIWKRALGGLSLAGVLLLASWLLGSTLGVAIASPFLKRTVGKAVPASLLMREFGLATVDELVHVIRLHGLRVYRTAQKLGNEIVENMHCRLEPLFAKYSYVPYMRSHFFSENRICFEKEQVDAAFTARLSVMMAARPELVRGMVDAVAEEDMQKLKQELAKARKTLKESNLPEGPAAKTAKHRLFIIAQLHIAVKVFGALQEKWSPSRKGYSIAEMNVEYAKIMRDDPDLQKLLAELKPDFEKQVFHPDALQLLRLGMPEAMVNWGGQQRAGLREIVEKLKTDSEKKA